MTVPAPPAVPRPALAGHIVRPASRGAPADATRQHPRPRSARRAGEL